MRRIAIEDIDSARGEIDRRSLSAALGAETVAINRYRLEPGEGLPGGLHAHMEQEEVFVVLDGALTFETMDRDIPVRAGEAVRFAPGEFQSGVNDADGPTVVLAMGAPPGTDDVRIPIECPECGQPDLRIEGSEDGPVIVCPACAVEFEPSGCPDCGAEMNITVSGPDRDVVAVCSACGAEHDSPPFLH